MIRILTGDCRELRAYAAGVIDSDGCIGVRRSTYSMRKTKDAKAPVFHVRVSIKQVSPEAINILHKTFGGALMLQSPSATKGKPLWYWEITNVKAETFLKAILPYLRIKKKQAENALLLREKIEASKRVRVAKGRGHIGAASRPEHITKEMENIYQQAKHLNRVGIA
jgi:hypothetical protein